MAKKFQFRLEPLLKMKAHVVRQIKEELSIVRGELSRVEDEIDRQSQYLEQFGAEALPTTGPAADLQARVYHKQFVVNDINRLKQEQAEITEREQEILTRLNEAMKEEKILIKLKGKKAELHEAKLNKEEMKILDEIAQQRSVNNK